MRFEGSPDGRPGVARDPAVIGPAHPDPQSGGTTMRALYLFLGEILGGEARADRAETRRRPVDDEPLRPIRAGAFARWMAAGDRAVPRAVASAAAPGRG
jgi:hypothetical protein